MATILAAADLGSNTAHILVAEVEPSGRIRKISDANEWLSLGETVTLFGTLPTGTIHRLGKCLTAFRRLAHLHQAERMWVFGTEALRRADNGVEALKTLALETGVQVELIDGRREAEIGLRGAWIDGAGSTPFSLCEIGGGSAQVAYCQAAQEISRERSLPLGTGTLIAKAGLTQPATPLQLEALEGLIAQSLEEVEFLGGSRLLTCGGVARGQWRALHPDGDAEIHVEELDYLAWACARLTGEQIAARFNVKLKRASSLLPGASVFRAVMRRGGFETMRVSKFGVREGAILEMFEGKITGCAP